MSRKSSCIDMEVPRCINHRDVDLASQPGNEGSLRGAAVVALERDCLAQHPPEDVAGQGSGVEDGQMVCFCPHRRHI